MSLPQKIHRLIRSNTFIKFCLIGIVNAIVGFSIIFSLIYIFNVNYLISNLIGYMGGIATSFTLNKYVNFKSEGHIKFELPVFLASFIIAYSMNTLVLYSMVDVFHQSKPLGIVLASAVYTILFYLASRFIVFKKKYNTRTPSS